MIYYNNLVEKLELPVFYLYTKIDLKRQGT